MSTQTRVPSDVEPTSLIDLVNDCREIAGVLGSSVIDLTGEGLSAGLVGAQRALTRVPLMRIPLDRLPFSFGAMPVEITEDLSVAVAGYEDYGS